MSINHKNSVINPDFPNLDNILKNYVLEYIKKIVFYLIICKWKLHFSDTIVNVESHTGYSVSAGYYLGDFV